MKHVVLSDPALSGYEYGMLRDFEDEIVRLTGAQIVNPPVRHLPRFIAKRIAHGTRYSAARAWIPRKQHDIAADVLWVVLMGPEDFSLDLFKGWDRRVGTKVLYLFDTMERQLPSIRRVLRAARWDLTITSFSGARRFLEEMTGRRWHVVPQGVKLERFFPVTPEERSIGFCSFGRRLEQIHQNVKAYSQRVGCYYHYSTAQTVQPEIDSREHYGEYAWHLNRSIFNVCWPVELTHPRRVNSFSPVTGRWFEAAASGNVVIGQAPDDPEFSRMFGADFVVPLDSGAGPAEVQATLAELWQKRKALLHAAVERRRACAQHWSWESRVNDITRLLDGTG